MQIKLQVPLILDVFLCCNQISSCTNGNHVLPFSLAKVTLNVPLKIIYGLLPEFLCPVANNYQ